MEVPTEEFRLLLKHFPKDGRPLFNMIRRVPIIYHDNYREYLMTSIKNVQLIDIDKNYLKNKFLPSTKKRPSDWPFGRQIGSVVKRRGEP